MLKIFKIRKKEKNKHKFQIYFKIQKKEFQGKQKAMFGRKKELRRIKMMIQVMMILIMIKKVRIHKLNNKNNLE